MGWGPDTLNEQVARSAFSYVTAQLEITYRIPLGGIEKAIFDQKMMPVGSGNT